MNTLKYIAWAGSLMLLSLFSVRAGASELPTTTVTLDIQPQPLDDALNTFGAQSGLQVVFLSEIGKGLIAPRLSGTYSFSTALERLLENTPLKFEFINAKTVAIRLAPAGEQKTSARFNSENFRFARAQAEQKSQAIEAAGAAAQSGESANTAREASIKSIEEIIVTAQKREERLQDVPVPVTAIDADTLVESNQFRIQDYYTRIPGLNLTMMGDVGVPLLSIRGVITGGYVSPTVGIVVDDIPFGASLNFTPAPDIDPSELSRVEVLRGPQGTLYGASSLGGLLKFVTADPSTERLSGRVQASTTTVRNGDGLGFSLRGAVNVPLSDKFAVRASASTRQDPGYIDNIQSGQEGVNRMDSQTGRFAALWRLSNDTSLKLSALHQRSKRYGTADVHLPSPVGPVPGLEDLQQYSLIDSGTYDQRLQAYSAVLEARVGRAELTSLSGYNVARFLSAPDGTSFYGNFMQAQYGVRGGLQWQDTKTRKFSQEFRLSMPLGGRVDWLLGAFYTDESYSTLGGSRAVNPATGAIAGEFYRSKARGGYSEYAAFTDLTFQITDRFDVQVGGRLGWMETTLGQSSSQGPYNTVVLRRSDPFSAPGFSARDSSFTYLITPRFRISPDMMAYARMASGYRPGGPNLNVLAQAAGFAAYGPDITENYEIGLKGAFLDRRVSFDASVYYIDWKNVQLQLRDPVNTLLTYTLNAGAARSQGAELSLELRPLKGLTISAWGAYDDAEFTDVPRTSVLTARAGDRLPYSAPWSGNFSIDQEFAIADNATGFVGASASYVGDRKGRFFTGVSQGTFPAYTQMDARAGVRFASWTINAFVNNVTDKRGVLRSGLDSSFVTYAVTYTQPRTFGVSLTRDF